MIPGHHINLSTMLSAIPLSDIRGSGTTSVPERGRNSFVGKAQPEPYGNATLGGYATVLLRVSIKDGLMTR